MAVPLRPPVELCENDMIALDDNSFITFKHPGYDGRLDQDILFRLRAYDHVGGGLHYGLALMVCGIMAGNTWDGYLTRTRDGDKVELSENDLLMDHVYYYHLPNQPDDGQPYPIYPSFEHWAFPHASLPPIYAASTETSSMKSRKLTAPITSSNFSQAVLTRDEGCLLTAATDFLQAAHLCPAKESEWFHSNTMSRYNKNRELLTQSATNDVANALALRPDIHMAFDNKRFAIVRKDSRWVAHFFRPTCALAPLHHNQIMNLRPEISPAFILARLAWTIFPFLQEFLTQGGNRFLTCRVLNDGRLEEETRWYSGSDIGNKLGRRSESPSKGSRSPKKRSFMQLEERDAPEYPPVKRQRCLKTASNPPAESLNVKRENMKEPFLEQNAPSATAQPWDLQSCSGDSNHSLVSSTPFDYGYPSNHVNDTPSEREHKKYTRQMTALKESWKRKGRPTNARLYCCDYTKAEQDMLNHVPGDVQKMGMHLCYSCLGFEVPPEWEDQDATVSETDEAKVEPLT